MIGIKDLYSVLTAVVPLYVTMFLAYASVKWWNIFTPEQCAGINRFVAIFAVPLLSFEFVSRINPYKMDLLFLAADGVSKILILVVLFCWANFSKTGSLDWSITLFSLSTLPNTLVMGIPLLKSMYGDDKEYLMIQVVVLQCIIWYTLLLFLFEYRETRTSVFSKFKESSFSLPEREKENFKGTAEKVGGNCSSEDEVINVIATTPSSQQTAQNVNKIAPDQSQRFKPMVAASVEGERNELHLFIWRCGCCISPATCESVQAGQREESSGKAVASEKQADVENSSIPSSVSSAMLLKILRKVWFKLVRNPNSYSSLLGLSWALVSCRWDIKKPQIMENSVTILSSAGLGMAMFSLGLFMALQPRIIACGTKLALYGMLARFITGPALMAIASVVVGLRGTTLKVSIVQAALPQGIVPFVFSREYNLHPDVLSTAVIFGMIVSLPITILYYILLGI
ncbi:PREDICTED: probable auxin efflux carrier component 1b [Theobroma cacao]|uniref:Auxin efflux carrier component n=1 Tax=Theobroma cacao TaxID=3641 RepID=A0AB32VAS1_THECC|nr:PREDICTED: probable auxin efflux carrier component 1b [Theobroma cacao]